MGAIRPHRPVLLLLAALSRHDEALLWARQQAEPSWGPVALASPAFPFTQTGYYEPTMGTDLRRAFFAFERLVDPGELAAIKRRTNQWESLYRDAAAWPEQRPLNLDPGYLTEAKLVLASTKDRDHRLYLDQGIYAEGTLYFQRGAWRIRPWTYPDYRQDGYHQFFAECRQYLRRRYRDGASPRR
jgi:hypothetical protein